MSHTQLIAALGVIAILCLIAYCWGREDHDNQQED